MSHRFELTVYYEDTDMGGIVYYANYLKFIERARSTWVAQLGVDQLALQASGMVFAVRSIQAEYLAPARLGDQLEVVSQRRSSTPARLRCGPRQCRCRGHAVRPRAVLSEPPG